MTKIITLLTLVALPFSVMAQTTIDWNGTAGDGAFETGGNWTGGVAPTNDLISNIAQLTGGTVDLSTTRQVSGLDFQSGSTLSGIGSIEIGGSGIEVNQNSVLNTAGLVLNQPNTTISLAGGRLSWGTGLTASGTGQLTVTGNNTLYMDGGANTYSGGTVITGGASVRLKNSDNLGTGNITIDNGTLAPNSGNTHIGETITIGAGGATVFASNGRLSLQNTISGSGTLTVNSALGGGDKTVYLDADNSATFSGDIHINGAGALLKVKGNSVALDSGTANLIVEDGGKLASNGQAVSLTGRNIQVNGTGGTIDTGGNTTINGTISGTGALALIGGGSATITTKDNTQTGGISIDGIQVALGASKDNGADVLGTGDVTLDNGARLKNNDNHQTVNNNVEIGSGGGTLMAGWGKNVTVNGAVSGAGTLTIEGDSGWVGLDNANNTFDGDIAFTTVYAGGKLRLDSLGADGQSYGGVISGTDASAQIELSGDILLEGDSTFVGLINVSGTGAVGGNGSIDGNLSLASGAGLVFDGDNIGLSVAGDVTLDSTFGIDDLIGISSGTADGTYTLIDETATSFASGFENIGAANAYDLGSGKSAYFEEGSLQVVVIPEPATLGLVAVFGASVLFIRRRFKA